MCLEIASQCFNRNELQKKDCYVYKVMYKNKWLEEVFEKRYSKQDLIWDYETLKNTALQYQTKNSFKWGNWNAYHAARRKSYFEEICSHMITISKSDKNVIYLLKAKDFYKVGVTSQRCNKRRLAELRRSSGFDFNIVYWIETSNADTLEQKMLKLGSIPDLNHFNGYKECRYFTDEELKKINYLLDLEVENL